MSDDQVHVEVDLEFPVSIETVLSVNFNIDNFKLIFDFILKTLRGHANSLHQVQETLEKANANEEQAALLAQLQSEILLLKEQSARHTLDLSEHVEKATADTERLEKELASTKEHFEQDLASIHEQLNKHQNNLDSLNSDVQQVNDHIKLLQDNVDKHSESIGNCQAVNENHEERISQLEKEVDSALQVLRNMGGEIEAAKRSVPAPIEKPAQNDTHKRDLAKLWAELDALKASIGDLDHLKDRIGQLETSKPSDGGAGLEEVLERLTRLEKDTELKQQMINRNKEDIENLKKLVKLLETNLNNKVHAEDFDTLQRQVYAGGSKEGGSAPPPVPTKDLNLLRELAKKVEELSAADPMAEIARLLERVATLETALDTKTEKAVFESLTKLVNNLKKRIEDLEGLQQASPTKVTGKGDADSSKLNSFNRRLVVLEEFMQKLLLPEGTDLMTMAKDIADLKHNLAQTNNEISRIYEELLSKLKELEVLIKSKASMDDLNALEKSIHEKVIAINEAMGKKFASKKETNKSLRNLERLIRELFESSKIKLDGNDAILARKPLGGWSCASCEKALEKLAGKIGPYQPWNKLPKRDPADRIARAGPGFSRMLATYQPEMYSQRTRTSGYNMHSINSPGEVEEELDRITEVVSLPPVTKQERPHTSYNS